MASDMFLSETEEIVLRTCSSLKTHPAQAREVLSGPSTLPVARAEAGTAGSCVGSLRLLDRRAPALGIPKLRGNDCPSFARCCTRSCAARSLASEASQGMTTWAHEGMR